MDFYVDVPEELYDTVTKFDPSLGIWFWNMAVMIAPMDTGNLRSAITLNSNTRQKINIRYNLMRANYIKFLELGVGPVKKYKGFIGVDTRMAIVEEYIKYLMTGRKPLITHSPFVVLKSSQNIFQQERVHLRWARMNTSIISAKTRGKISQIREAEYRRVNNIKTTQFRGQKVNKRLLGSNKGINKGIGTLNDIYNQVKSGMR